MSQLMLGMVPGTEHQENREEKRTKASIWGDVLSAMIDPVSGMDESERKGYEQKIMQKLKMGKRLTSEELDYLRLHNPELYRTAMRVENARKALQQRLKNCKSKEEVSQVIAGQMEVLKAMENDPDREYMTAMVKEEISHFRQSREYARLPLKREEGKKKKAKQPDLEVWDKEKEENECNKVMIYSRMQMQCKMISRMARAFV